jgi:hypothetical protein
MKAQSAPSRGQNMLTIILLLIVAADDPHTSDPVGSTTETACSKDECTTCIIILDTNIVVFGMDVQ